MKHFEIPDDIRAYVRKRRIIRLSVCVALFAVLGVVGYFFINRLYPMNRNLSYLVFSLAILLVTGVPHKLIDPTWSGTILSSKNVITTERPFGMPYSRENMWTAAHRKLLVVDDEGNTHVRRSEKVREKFSQEISDELIPGNYALHVGGTKYTLVFTKEPQHFRCAVCGMENPTKNTHCADCGHTLIRLKI